jgi:flagellar motility protein MotE (MotC chaperone)
MIAKLQSPAVKAALGFVLSVGVGVGLCWRAAGPIMETVAKARPKAPELVEDKTKGWDFWTIEIENISNELKEERARLKKQSDLLDQRAARIAADGKELEKIRGDIEKMRKEIGDKVTEIHADESKNLRTLAQTYANLTPKAVVAIFRDLDDTTAVKILSLMKSDIVGPIFEEMSRANGGDAQFAKRAAILTEKMRLMKSGKS